jgi:hypothetical protein
MQFRQCVRSFVSVFGLGHDFPLLYKHLARLSLEKRRRRQKAPMSTFRSGTAAGGLPALQARQGPAEALRGLRARPVMEGMRDI